MGFGSTAKKIQKLADIADELYTKVTELKAQLQSLQRTVETTDERVADIDQELTRQRALMEALAEEQGVDIEAVLADAEIDGTEGGGATADANASVDGDANTDADDTGHADEADGTS